jgi:hypothetical protein
MTLFAINRRNLSLNQMCNISIDSPEQMAKWNALGKNLITEGGWSQTEPIYCSGQGIDPASLSKVCSKGICRKSTLSRTIVPLYWTHLCVVQRYGSRERGQDCHYICLMMMSIHIRHHGLYDHVHVHGTIHMHVHGIIFFGLASPVLDKNEGPSTGAVTALIIVSCVASILALVAFIVHRQSRIRGSMSESFFPPGSGLYPANDHGSELDYYYDVDEAYMTSQTISKYRTASANDATLTKIPADDIAIARHMGDDLWMGENTKLQMRVVLRRAPRVAVDHVMDSFFQGVKEMARLSHPNLVSYLGVTCLSGTDIYAVAEFMDQGSLMHVYQTMPLMTADASSSSSSSVSTLEWSLQLKMARDIVEAITYLHALVPSPVPCENLKSTNILVNPTFQCKLNIFNFMASYQSSLLCKEIYGANRIAWKAPEVLRNEMKNFLAADMYSVGVVLAEIGTTTRPFDREIREVLFICIYIYMYCLYAYIYIYVYHVPIAICVVTNTKLQECLYTIDRSYSIHTIFDVCCMHVQDMDMTPRQVEWRFRNIYIYICYVHDTTYGVCIL